MVPLKLAPVSLAGYRFHFQASGPCIILSLHPQPPVVCSIRSSCFTLHLLSNGFPVTRKSAQGLLPKFGKRYKKYIYFLGRTQIYFSIIVLFFYVRSEMNGKCLNYIFYWEIIIPKGGKLAAEGWKVSWREKLISLRGMGRAWKEPWICK